MKASDTYWFRPLWRRIAVTGFLVAWLAWELLWSRDQFWALLVGAALVYSLYSFFYAFPKDEAGPEPVSPPPRDDGTES